MITGSQDGVIKLWNIDTGDCEKSLSANNNAIVEMTLIERDSKPSINYDNLEFPIVLSCSAKDRSLVLTRT